MARLYPLHDFERAIVAGLVGLDPVLMRLDSENILLWADANFWKLPMNWEEA